MHPIPHFRRPNASVALLGAAFAAAFIVAGCSYTPTAAAAHVLHVRLSVRERGNNFEVRLPAGDITIMPGPAGRVSLRGTASYKGERQPAISFTTIGGLMGIDHLACSIREAGQAEPPAGEHRSGQSFELYR